MAHDLQPLTPNDLPDLAQFLTEGFRAPAGAAFSDLDVLRWKYFDPLGVDAGDTPRSYLVRDPRDNRVVGHVGICPGRFRGGGLPAEGVSTLHLIDWLGSEAARGVGATLMQRGHRAAETQYGIGSSPAARRVGERNSYALIAVFPVFLKVLRAGYRLKDPAHGPIGRALRAAADAASAWRTPMRTPRRPIELRPVRAFGAEIDPILLAYQSRAVLASRGPDALNHLLRYPRDGISGWHLLRDGALRGLAVLSIIPGAGTVRVGKIAECLLDDPDDDAWHAATRALTVELTRQGADAATAFASTEWAARALTASGFARAYDLKFNLRDRRGKIPRGVPFHLTPLDADYAYT